jgi:hypothetical protein
MGCVANNIAAINGGERYVLKVEEWDSLRKCIAVRNTKTETPACSTIFIRWNPHGMRPKT